MKTFWLCFKYTILGYSVHIITQQLNN